MLTRRDFLLTTSAAATGLAAPRLARAQSEKSGGMLRLSVTFGLNTISPIMHISGAEWVATKWMYNNLTRLNVKREVVPDLAESWARGRQRAGVDVQAAPGREVPHRPGGHGRRRGGDDPDPARPEGRVALPRRDRAGRPGRGGGQAHGALHAQGAVRGLPGHHDDPQRPHRRPRGAAGRQGARREGVRLGPVQAQGVRAGRPPDGRALRRLLPEGARPTWTRRTSRSFPSPRPS